MLVFDMCVCLFVCLIVVGFGVCVCCLLLCLGVCLWCGCSSLVCFCVLLLGFRVSIVVCSVVVCSVL